MNNTYKGLGIPIIKKNFLETLPIEKYLTQDCLYITSKYGSEQGLCDGILCHDCLFDEDNRHIMLDYLIEKGIINKGARLKIELDGGLSWLE